MVCLKEDITVVLPTGFGKRFIYSRKHSRRKKTLFHFHQLENVCSCGESFGIHSEATTRESKKSRIELGDATIGESAELDSEIRHCLRKG